MIHLGVKVDDIGTNAIRPAMHKGAWVMAQMCCSVVRVGPMSVQAPPHGVVFTPRISAPRVYTCLVPAMSRPWIQDDSILQIFAQRIHDFVDQTSRDREAFVLLHGRGICD
jgi:hypothetical protein